MILKFVIIVSAVFLSACGVDTPDADGIIKDRIRGKTHVTRFA